MIIGLICLGILILWELKFMKSIEAVKLVPGPLAAVVAGTVLNQVFMNSQPFLALEASHLVALPVASDARSS